MQEVEMEDQCQPLRETTTHQQEAGDSGGDDLLLPKSLVWCLYTGHFLSRWSARMWEFSVALYMIDIWPNSLLLTALYGVTESTSISLFGPLVGHFVNILSYLKILRIWILTQNFSFIVAGGTVVALLFYTELKSTNPPFFATLVILTYISGAVGVLSTLAGTILIEREWVVVISEGHPPEVLTNMNSVIRRIDLICKLAAPVVAGFLISFVSLASSAVFLGIWNIITVCLLYWLLISVYEGIPALKQKGIKNSVSPQSDPEGSTSTATETQSLLSQERTKSAPGTSSRRRGLIERISEAPCIASWKVYLKQDVVLPGVALALLYFTVLSFGSLMTATLEWDGVPAYVISIGRGISAMIGIGATYTYPILQSRISTLRTGLWSVWSQWSFLLICVASIWFKNGVTSAYLLMGGVAFSRLGLWMFDLAVIQQMQDQVLESDRCLVGGVQNSLQSTMDLMGYLMGVIVSDPEDFWKLIWVSFAVVTLAGLLYTLHIWRVRKHLFHFEKLHGIIKLLVGSPSPS